MVAELSPMFGAVWLEAVLPQSPSPVLSPICQPRHVCPESTTWQSSNFCWDLLQSKKWGNFIKSRQEIQEKKYSLLSDGHNTKGLEHKTGRKLGCFSCQPDTAVVGLFLAYSQSLIYIMLLKSFGSSFALTVEAALVTEAPSCQSLRRTRWGEACVPKAQEEETEGKQGFPGASVWLEYSCITWSTMGSGEKQESGTGTWQKGQEIGTMMDGCDEQWGTVVKGFEEQCGKNGEWMLWWAVEPRLGTLIRREGQGKRGNCEERDEEQERWSWHPQDRQQERQDDGRLGRGHLYK